MPHLKRALAILAPFVLGACEAAPSPTELNAPALRNGAALSQQFVTLCMTGPEGDVGSFSIQATGGERLTGASGGVALLDVKPQGVFPAACTSVWRSTAAGPETVTITQSGTFGLPGTALGEITVFGEGTSDVGARSATVEVSDQSGAFVIFKKYVHPDQTPPVVDSILVATESGSFGRSVAVDVSDSDQVVRVRVFARDEGGSGGIILPTFGAWLVGGAIGATARRCSETLVSGDPTDGVWGCEVLVVHDAPPGTRTPGGFFVRDSVLNVSDYAPGPGGTCVRPENTICLPFLPMIEVSSDGTP